MKRYQKEMLKDVLILAAVIGFGGIVLGATLIYLWGQL